MSRILPVNVALNSEDAIALIKTELNRAMVSFDRWASENPQKLHPTDPEFKAMKQTIKLLRLRLKDYEEISRKYQETVRLLQLQQPEVLWGTESPSHPFTKSRNTEELRERPAMKLGGRPSIKVSRG